MYRTGHYGAALAAYAPIAFVLLALGFRELAVLGGVGAAALAMLPDYDQRVPGVTHRGPTHTVWFAVLVGGVLGVGGGLAGSSQGALATVGLAVFAFVVGSVVVLSHIAADALTPAGVRPFEPIRSRRYTYDVAKAKNPVANYGLLVLGAIVCGLALAAGSAAGQFLGQF